MRAPYAGCLFREDGTMLYCWYHTDIYHPFYILPGITEMSDGSVQLRGEPENTLLNWVGIAAIEDIELVSQVDGFITVEKDSDGLWRVGRRKQGQFLRHPFEAAIASRKQAWLQVLGDQQPTETLQAPPPILPRQGCSVDAAGEVLWYWKKGERPSRAVPRVERVNGIAEPQYIPPHEAIDIEEEVAPEHHKEFFKAARKLKIRRNGQRQWRIRERHSAEIEIPWDKKRGRLERNVFGQDDD